MAMTNELTMLGWGLILALVQIVLQASLCSLDVGLPYAVGPQDDTRSERNVYARRSRRALHNLIETFVLFAALALALAVTGKSGGIAATGAMIWFWARVAYLAIYMAGIPVARTIAWTLSIVGIVMMLIKFMS